MGVLLNVQVFRGGQPAGAQQFDSDTHRTIKIGRLASAQIKLEDPKVSRIHAVIEFAGNDMSLIDMGSTEGTIVNGAKVHKVKLNSGDQVLIGDTTLVVTTGAAAQMAAPAGFAAAATVVTQAPGGFAGAPTAVTQAPAGFGAAPTMVTPAPAWNPTPMAAPAAPGAVPNAWPKPGAPAAPAPAFRPNPMMPPTGGAPVAMQAPVMAPVAAPAPAIPATQTGPVQPRFDAGGATEASTPIKRITQQRLRSAAVESKPHPALAPEQPMTADNRLLEMRLYWGEVLLGINHYFRPKKITMGETKRTNVFISSEGLPVEEFPFLRYIDDEYVFTFASSMEGELELGGQMQTLQAIKGTSVVKRDDEFPDSYTIKLPPDARLILHHGGATFAVRFVAPSEGLSKSLFQDIDWQANNFMVMSLVFHVAMIIMLMVTPYDTELLREDLFDKPDRFAALILEPPKQTEETKDLLKKIEKKIEEKKPEEKKEEEKPKEKELVVKQKVPQNIKPQKTQQQKQEEVRQKFTKLFSGSGAGAGSILGGGGGGSLSGTLSNVIGTAGAGSSSAGMAGLGIRGTGPLTGGGVGTSRGIAGIGTSGRLGGGGLAYGSGVGLGSRRNTNVLDIGTPVVMGSLDPAIIKKVIDENKAQIRYCYERELQRNQNLEGKIQMKWVIAATGSVASVKVRESTMNNGNVEGCIADKIKTWRFPAPAGGGIVEVNYPFIFKAS